MKKIAILGCENSHADHFCKFIHEEEEYKDIEVVGIYSHEREAAEKLHEKFPDVPVMDNYDDLVGKIDGLVVTARHGDNHYKYAKPYMESGIPMFIDKPVTVSEEDALALVADAKKYGVKLTGGSSLKLVDDILAMRETLDAGTLGKTVGGYVRAPINLDNPHGGFFFYSAHLVEMITAVHGKYPHAVMAMQSGDNITVVFRYADYDITGLFTTKARYYANLQGETGTMSLDVAVSPSAYDREFGDFQNILTGGEQRESYKDFIAPVFILNAIDRSLKSGKMEEVKEYDV